MKKMDKKDEKYQIKPRRKYQRQVWLKDGRAIIIDPVDPIEPEDPKDHPNQEKRMEE